MGLETNRYIRHLWFLTFMIGCGASGAASVAGELRLDLLPPAAAGGSSLERDAMGGSRVELIDDTMTLSLFQPEDDAPAPNRPATDDRSLAEQLQNPIADLISVPFQFNYDNGFDGNADRLTLNIQPVIPISINKDWNVISRTIIPLIYQESGGISTGPDSATAIGDTLQSFFFSPKQAHNGWTFGVGPVLLLPTGTRPEFRSEQLGFGPTAVALRQHDGWTYGGLVNHVWGVTPSDDRPDVNATFVQPFLAYTWPSATTLALNTETSYDWTAQQWTVPVNLMLSQIVKFGDHPVQLQVGGRYYAESASGGPDWGLRFTVTFLFPR